MRILFLPNSYDSPPSRYRIWQFVDPLRKLGHEVTVRVIWPERNWTPSLKFGLFKPVIAFSGTLLQRISALWITRDIEHFDIVMMNRDILPSIRFSSIESWLCKRNPRIIFDFDDAIFLGPRNQKLKKILKNFALLTPGNSYLAEFARSVNGNVRIWPTVIDTDAYQPLSHRSTGKIRIGWSGSVSTVKYCLPLLENVITKLSSIEDFEFVVITKSDPKIDWKNVNYRFVPWTPETEVVGIQQLDIGLMPLEDTPFQRGKCGLKAIQYMAAGIPALVSPVGVNAEIVIHGRQGFHCRTEDDWIKYMQLLIHDEILRKKLGQAARERVVNNYSINSIIHQMVREFQIISQRR